jgi:hypothetical protein
MSTYKPTFANPGVQSAPDPVAELASAAKPITPTTNFTDLVDYSFFLLGPIYEFVKLPFDLVQQFISDTKLNLDIKTYIVDYVLVQGLKDWPNIIYAIPKSAAELFTKWMVTQIFRDSNLNLTWEIRGRQIELIDPGAIHNRQAVHTEIPITIFLPYCDKVVIDGIYSTTYPGTAYRLFIRKPSIDEFKQLELPI